jgi:hypothetical protein
MKVKNRNSANFAERLILNYITTHRTIRQLADYYDIPRSSIAYILKRAEDKVEYELYQKYKMTAAMHRRAQCMRWKGEEEYFSVEEHGPLD